ncbi:MAG: HD domain-containing protein, partial [Mariprofundaceae bacterium]
RVTRLPLAHDVIRKLKRPELLYIALLFHDIAKGEPGDHSIVGEAMARVFCRRIHLSDDAVELVSWLVREHLTMAVKSQRFDLSDPDVIRIFAERMGDIERLDYLLCLTVADISAVGPNVWNDWKGSLLRDIYHASARVFMGEEVGGDELKSRIRMRIESTISKANNHKEALEDKLKLMPWRCMMHFPPRQLLPLAELLRVSESGEHVSWFVDKRRCETMVMVVANERPGLFAILTGAIALGHVAVVAAQAYELLDGRAMDIFHVQATDESPLDDEGDLFRLKTRIEKALSAEADLQEPPSPRFKRSVLMEQVEVRVRELPLASSVQTAIEVSAANRSGLLAQLAYQISYAGFSLRGAAVSTFGERAVDVFFVQGKDSPQLSTDEQERLHHQLMNIAKLPEV